MMKKMILKRLAALCMAGGLLFSSVPALNAAASEEKVPVSAAVTNYCDLSGSSFTVTDVRTNETKTFDGSAGKNAVFIYGRFGLRDTDNAVSSFADIMPFLEPGKLDVFVMERSDADESSIKASAEEFDPDRALIVSKLGEGKDLDVFSDIYVHTIGSGNYYYTPLVVYVNGNGTVYAFTEGTTSTNAILDNLVAGGLEENYRGRTISPAVEKHTIDEIRQFAKEHSVTFSTEYKEEPSAVQPYKLGAVSDASLQDALNMVNQVRYIAGLSHDVTLDDDYNKLAQAASLVNAANGQGLSHFPNRPAGMDDELYDLGYEGASQSNLSAGRKSIADTIVYGYMDDGDEGNIAVVGHRRWVLNPSMGKTGFGFVASGSSYYGKYSAMYAFDGSGKRTGKVSMWPAMNMPVEYFGSGYPWSYSTGDLENIDEVKVTLTDTKTGENWIFSNASSDGYFNVENSGYGLTGCIIFRPDNAAYEAGDKFSVKIEGLSGDTTVEYDVYFFSLDNPKEGEGEEEVKIHPTSVTLDKTEVSLQAGKTLQLTATVEPSDSDDKTVEWTTSDSDIVSVSEDGMVTALSEGTAVVTVQTKDGGLTASCTVTVTAQKTDPEPDPDPESEPDPEPDVVSTMVMFRLYNPNSGEHFYTADEKERNDLVAIGWKNEGSAWTAPEKSGTPVYRLYNPNAGDHHYTTDVKERDNLVAVGWKSEGIGWYSDDDKKTPLYRLYNPNALLAGAHHYTANKAERDNLKSLGWKDEGIGWYGR